MFREPKKARIIPGSSTSRASLAPTVHVPTAMHANIAVVPSNGVSITDPQPTRPTLSAYSSPARSFSLLISPLPRMLASKEEKHHRFLPDLKKMVRPLKIPRSM